MQQDQPIEIETTRPLVPVLFTVPIPTGTTRTRLEKKQQIDQEQNTLFGTEESAPSLSDTSCADVGRISTGQSFPFSSTSISDPARLNLNTTLVPQATPVSLLPRLSLVQGITSLASLIAVILSSRPPSEPQATDAEAGQAEQSKTKHIQLTPIPCRRTQVHHTSTPPHPCPLPTPPSVPVPPSPSSAGSQSSTNQQYEVPAAPKNQNEHQRRTSQVLLHVGACHPSIHPSIWCPAPVPSFLDLVFSTLRNLNLCSIEAGDPFQRLPRLRPPSIPAHHTEQSLLDTLRPHILLEDALLS
ncbi:hypothetical protein CPAR01_07357 [Colletotrichum paranaense]|uniref:Uncharacterized protein n=1 Tax=Colletotrichum paranaense TaxID=1914294 RepID=A0ABQ9SPD8_9PEZI|nr:uncharacterized protein CPAR01_07357 [Colletotrichum paranaense]KAK1541368.1 hypothetical protein CPAR01_07357 [Colletotrichum paranaense]